MKLKTKLMISFILIILIPLVLFVVFGAAIIRLQSRLIRTSYGISAEVSDMFLGSSGLYDQLMQKVQDDISAYVGENQEILEDKEAMGSYLKSVAGDLINVVVLKDGDLYYTYNHLQTAVLKELVAAGAEEDRTGTAIYIRRQGILMGRAYEGRFADGSKAQIYTIADVRQLLPEVRRMIIQFVLTMVFVLVITACLFTVWIYRSVVRPIKVLQQATGEIKKGNLDFHLEAMEKDELGELTEDFDEMRERLKTGTEEKLAFDRDSKDLIRNISHDLKTPLTTIRGYTEGLLDGVADTEEKRQRYLKTIRSKADEMQSLIDELSFYARIDTNRIPYNFCRLDIGAFFADCADELSEELSARQIEFSYDNQVEGGTMVIADPEQLRRVIQNIVGNSCKYFDKEEKQFSLSLADAGDFVLVRASDNGCGIAPADLPYIFDRFYRTDTSRSSGTGGSGIGLSIVKKIIEDHGGRVWAGAEEGKGTVITIELRKHREPVFSSEGSIAEVADGDLRVIREPEKKSAEKPKDGSVKA